MDGDASTAAELDSGQQARGISGEVALKGK